MIVRKLRLQRGWTQEQLAELSGLGVRSIQRIERGRPGSLETLRSLAAVFEVELSTLQPGDESMSNEQTVTADEKAAMDYVRGVKEFWSHALMYAVFSVVFLLVMGPEKPVVFWGFIGWGVGVIFHGLVAYEIINVFSANWERRMIEKRLGRKL